jgi:hypothetical protein
MPLFINNLIQVSCFAARNWNAYISQSSSLIYIKIMHKIYLTLIIVGGKGIILEKAKPVARRGRKTTGLMETAGLPRKGGLAFSFEPKLMSWKKLKLVKPSSGAERPPQPNLELKGR